MTETPSVQPPEASPQKPEAIKPPSTKEILILTVKNRLNTIASQAGKDVKERSQPQPQEERKKAEEIRNTAQSLLGLLEKKDKPLSSLTTDLEPLKDEEEPASDDQSKTKETPTSSEKAESPPKEEKKPITYKVQGVDYNQGLIITQTSDGKEVKFSLVDITLDMGKTLGIPLSEDLIKAALLGQEIDGNKADEIAQKLGYITYSVIEEILFVPPDKELIIDGKKVNLRQALLEKKESELTPLERAQRKYLEIVKGKPPDQLIIRGEEVQEIFENLNKGAFGSLFRKEGSSVREVIKNIWDHLPQEEKEKCSFESFVQSFDLPAELLEQKFGNLSEFINSYHQQIEKGNIPQFNLSKNVLESMVESLLKNQQISQESKEKIKSRIKTGMGTISLIAFLMAFLLASQAFKKS